MTSYEITWQLLEEPGDAGFDGESYSLHADQSLPQAVIDSCLHRLVTVCPVNNGDELVVLLCGFGNDSDCYFAILVIDEQDNDEGQVRREEEADVLGAGSGIQSEMADDFWCIDGPAGSNMEDVIPFPGDRYLERPLQGL